MSQREQILNDYDVNASGMITSPGKFEGEPIFAPYYWEQAVCIGAHDGETDDGGLVFYLDADDYAMWPELRAWLGDKNTLIVRETGRGFVTCEPSQLADGGDRL